MAKRSSSDALVQRRRTEILRAATPVFASKGFRRTDVQEIADALGIGKGTIYRYYPTKEALFLAVADAAMNELVQAVYSKALTVSDPIERIRAGLREYFRFLDEHREFVDIFAHERSEFRDRVEPAFLGLRDQMVAQLEMVLFEMRLRGCIREGVDLNMAASLFGDMLPGIVYTHYRTGGSQLADKADQVLNLFLHGILKPDARPTPLPADSTAEGQPGSEHC